MNFEILAIAKEGNIFVMKSNPSAAFGPVLYEHWIQGKDNIVRPATVDDYIEVKRN